jgi:hypothetical protein
MSIGSGDRWPMFSFARVDTAYGGEWGWTMEDAERILDFLRTVSQSKWHELMAMTAGRHKRHHWQPVKSLDDPAKDRLAQLHWDMDDIFRFRSSGKERLWGFIDGDLFYPIWWDPNHRVYPTEPN